MDAAIDKGIRDRKFDGLEMLDQEKQALVEERNKMNIYMSSMMVALDAKIKETEDKIQACVSKREFKELTSLEAQKTEFQRQKRDMELCDSKEASVAGAVCGLMNASDDSVSVKIAEIDERIVALEVAIEACAKERKFSGLAALGEEKRQLVLVKE